MREFAALQRGSLDPVNVAVLRCRTQLHQHRQRRAAVVAHVLRVHTQGTTMPRQARSPAKLMAMLELPADALTITAAPPEMISQRNVESVTGIPARVYLEEIRSPSFPVPVVKLGKLRLVKRAAFVAYLESLATGPGLARTRAEGTVGDDAVAGVLAEVGFAPLPPSSSHAPVLRAAELPVPRRGSTGK